MCVSGDLPKVTKKMSPSGRVWTGEWLTGEWLTPGLRRLREDEFSTTRQAKNAKPEQGEATDDTDFTDDG